MRKVPPLRTLGCGKTIYTLVARMLRVAFDKMTCKAIYRDPV